MKELITEAYEKRGMVEHKWKKQKWLKGPKIPHELLNDATMKIRMWN
jgi:hypothetical protein